MKEVKPIASYTDAETKEGKTSTSEPYIVSDERAKVLEAAKVAKVVRDITVGIDMANGEDFTTQAEVKIIKPIEEAIETAKLDISVAEVAMPKRTTKKKIKK